MKVLLETVAGSHLYGLNHKDSDLDIYRVVEAQRRAKTKYIKQKIKDGKDITTVDISTWLMLCCNGSHQALEAMFSRRAHIDLLTTFRNAYTVNLPAVTTTYRRTIGSFADGGFKQRRHALRLMINLKTLTMHGQFNPTLSVAQINRVNELANSPHFDNIISEFLER